MKILLACGLACLAAPQIFSLGSTPAVEAQAVLANDAARVGSTFKAAVVAKIPDGYHINDHNPTLDYLIPTEVKIETQKEFSVEKLVYPKGGLKKFEFSDAALSVYEGQVVVGVLLKVDGTVKPGEYTLSGKFSYQACNDHACFPPTSVPVSLTVKVAPRSTSLKSINADLFKKIRFD